MSKARPYFVSDEASKDPDVLRAIAAHFDEETDAEEAESMSEALAEKKQKEIELYAKKLCILRTITFPLDIVFGTAMLGLRYGKNKLLLERDMIKFIFNKITLKEVLKSIEKYS
jgi:hypothetical protein